MRIRTIKPSFWRDDKIVSLSINARLLFIGLLNVADDYGIFEDNLKLIKADLFPLDDDIRVESISKWIDELRKARLTIPFTFETKGYQYIRTFQDHQRINRPSIQGCFDTKKLTSFFNEIGITGELCSFEDISMSIHGVLTAGNGRGNGRGNGNGEGEDCDESSPPPEIKFSKKMIQEIPKEIIDELNQKLQRKNENEKKTPPIVAAPPLNEVIKYFEELGFPKEAEKFHDYYQGNGWIIGRTGIKDWRATARSWVSRINNYGNTATGNKKAGGAPERFTRSDFD